MLGIESIFIADPINIYCKRKTEVLIMFKIAKTGIAKEKTMRN